MHNVGAVTLIASRLSNGECYVLMRKTRVPLRSVLWGMIPAVTSQTDLHWATAVRHRQTISFVAKSMLAASVAGDSERPILSIG